MKNIILLSDGTGNGAAKRHGTNVWRLYSTLDLHRDDQVAFYDDGVGSQEFLPLKIIGGAFGYGLKRNVIELYKFLCRNYKPGDKGNAADRIYLFGFSRGAFTVRVLAGMIDYCGLYTGFENEADLGSRARRNYSAFRSGFRHGLLSRAFRFLTRVSDVPVGTVRPDIEFIGVWDTVDAYGLPVDELAILWDRLIFPIRFPDCRLSHKVQRACHALSIDDERHTFHPVLWDESRETTDRIEQVWFAGVHSDVGGGYPRKDLSLVTLDWMMARVEAADEDSPGLHFIDEKRKEILSHCDWHGVQHDSRSGFASYYRYKPRNIAHLCDDRDNDVFVQRPKIHRGVLERIKGNAVPYAPTGLPASYDVVVTRGGERSYESSEQGVARANALNYALDVVYWRRWLYAAFLLVTLVLVTSRFFLTWSAGGICEASACVIDPLLQLAIDTLPDFAAGWFEALRQNPAWLWGFVLAFGILFYLKSSAWRKTRFAATNAWAELKGRGSPPEWIPTLTSKLRGRFRGGPGKAIRWAAVFILFVLLLVLLLVLAGRASFYARNTLGYLCEATGQADLRNVIQPATVTFDISNPCFATGLGMQEGATYRFDVEPCGELCDGSRQANPDGFTSFRLAAWTPLRRSITEPWLKLMGQTGDAGKEYFAIGSGLRSYTARSDGELFLYVNDAVFGFFPERYWAWPYFWKYGPNSGAVTVTVTQLDGNEQPVQCKRPEESCTARE